ncbi:MAG: aminoacyl-tRNA hydrolase [Verrucomicrobia bacterium]|nr:aminoacyl-tRNA hydrolase [Verrucomicrobiota bacterium]MCH8525696.1 aminoacyl-tRNA hydrolase [Kiritimatiellia bacterium]
MRSSIQLVVGLGNPGPAYDNTPHNIGFEVLDLLAARHNLRFKRGFGLRSWVSAWHREPSPVRLLKPRTFMNRSGEAVAKAVRRWKLSPENVLIVYDDLELPLGRLRLRKRGSAGGHNGVTSVIRCLGDSQEFPRLRIGVGPRPPGEELIRYVLSPWRDENMKRVEESRNRAADAVTSVLQGDFEAAMNQFN